MQGLVHRFYQLSKTKLDLSAGMFLGASGVVLEGIADVETAEAIACREGLALASGLTLQSIWLASDNANVIRSYKC